MFRPILCPDPSSSSRFVVALPIPLAKVWTGAILGASGAHIQCLRKLNGLHGRTDLTINTKVTDETMRWLSVKGRGEIWQVDSLIESVFFLLTTASLTWSTVEWSERLTAHVTAFQERRRESSQEFHSLQSMQSRSSYPSTGGPAVPQSLSSPVIVCMSDLDRKRCRSNGCRHSHLSYVEHFTFLCDRRPTSLASIADTTAGFHPILASSTSPSSPPRFVVSCPIPRIPFLLSFVVGSQGSTIHCLMRATGLQRIVFWPKNSPPYVPGSPAVDWLTLRAEGVIEQVDVLIEGVFWIMESGGTILEAKARVDALRDHLRQFKHRRSIAELPAGEFLSLASRHGRSSVSNSCHPDSSRRDSGPEWGRGVTVGEGNGAEDRDWRRRV